jgi:hypothetical protein
MRKGKTNVNKKISISIGIMTLTQFIFSTERLVPSLQILSSMGVAKNMQKDLYERFPDAKPVKKSLRAKLSIDGDFGLDCDISQHIQFADSAIQNLCVGMSVGELIAEKICARLSHIIDKAGRYVAKHYHDQLNGTNIDAIALSGLEPNAFCLIINEYLHAAIARSARYNFVLHYGYDKERFDNHYRYDFYYDDYAVKDMYHKYFEPRKGDKCLNHGTMVKGLFFGSSGESFSQSATYFRHVLIKVALENTADCSMLENLQASHTVKQVVNDVQLYQQERVAARNAGRDGLLWSKELLDQAIAKEKYNIMWYKEILRYGATLAWLAWIRYYGRDVKL